MDWKELSKRMEERIKEDAKHENCFYDCINQCYIPNKYIKYYENVHTETFIATKKQLDYFKALNAKIIKSKTYRLENDDKEKKGWIVDFNEQNALIDEMLELGYPIQKEQMSNLIRFRVARLEWIEEEEGR